MVLETHVVEFYLYLKNCKFGTVFAYFCNDPKSSNGTLPQKISKFVGFKNSKIGPVLAEIHEIRVSLQLFFGNLLLIDKKIV